jgi:hypothetical protein
MKPNPIHRIGTKNALYTYYTDCLDHAVSGYGRLWDGHGVPKSTSMFFLILTKKVP